MAGKIEEKELQDFGTLANRYRVRMVDTGRGRALDVREWIDTDTFTGFTRKGIRVDRVAAAELAQMIETALKAGL